MDLRGSKVVFIISLILLVVVMGFLDARVGWPGPTERVERYVSITEQSKTLRRD
jgi:uncharacterized membrane protein